MEISDKIFLALFASLFLAVLLIRRQGGAVPMPFAFKELPGGKVNEAPNFPPRDTHGPSNLPLARAREIIVVDVSSMSETDAAVLNG